MDYDLEFDAANMMLSSKDGRPGEFGTLQEGADSTGQEELGHVGVHTSVITKDAHTYIPTQKRIKSNLKL